MKTCTAKSGANFFWCSHQPPLITPYLQPLPWGWSGQDPLPAAVEGACLWMR